MCFGLIRWYSAGSSWSDLPNGHKISGWLHQFLGKLAVHPGVGVAQLTISKFLRNPRGGCAARHPPTFEQLEYCWPWNIVKPLSTLHFSDSWGSQQSKEHIITGAGIVQPGKSYHAVRTGEFNRRTSENPYVIASIEAPLKSAAWRSKFAIFHTCPTFFFGNFLVALCRFGGPVPFAPCLMRGFHNISMRNYSSTLDLHFQL